MINPLKWYEGYGAVSGDGIGYGVGDRLGDGWSE